MEKQICSNCQKEINKYGCACAFAVESLNKQTSVDFFWKQLAEILPSSVDTETGVKLHRAFEQAKQMEKEQMIDAILDNRNITSQVTLRDAELYYNETYGGQDE